MPESQKQTVLITDDEPANIDIISLILKRLDVDTRVALSGQEALTLLEQHPVDMVLLDIMMPDMNGFEVLEKIRETHNMQALPVVLLSALDSTEDIIKGLELGANDYIPKLMSSRLIHTRLATQLQLMRLDEERQHTLAMMRKANETNTRLMRIASHDLKNPLNNLSMVLSVLEQDPLTAPEYLPIAFRSIDTMTAIINEFLDSGILRNGEFEINLQPVSVADAIYDVLQTFQQAATVKGVSLLHDISPATITADERRLAQVLSNLVSNAIKYTYPSTTIYIQGMIDEKSYQIDVIDQGRGIDPQEVDKLFKPFSQLSNEPTGGENSTGLGLWIVQQMVQAQGGEVGVNLEVSDGANFWVRFPLAT